MTCAEDTAGQEVRVPSSKHYSLADLSLCSGICEACRWLCGANGRNVKEGQSTEVYRELPQGSYLQAQEPPLVYKNQIAACWHVIIQAAVIEKKPCRTQRLKRCYTQTDAEL